MLVLLYVLPLGINTSPFTVIVPSTCTFGRTATLPAGTVTLSPIAIVFGTVMIPDELSGSFINF